MGYTGTALLACLAWLSATSSSHKLPAVEHSRTEPGHLRHLSQDTIASVMHAGMSALGDVPSDASISVREGLVLPDLSHDFSFTVRAGLAAVPLSAKEAQAALGSLAIFASKSSSSSSTSYTLKNSRVTISKHLDGSPLRRPQIIVTDAAARGLVCVRRGAISVGGATVVGGAVTGGAAAGHGQAGKLVAEEFHKSVELGGTVGQGQGIFVTVDDVSSTSASGGHGATASAGQGATASAGQGATASAGQGATASVGHGATASAGHGATASAGQGATASAGQGATASAGHGATASAGHGGATASAGHEATASAGHGATASAGHGATVSAGHDSSASSGHEASASGHGEEHTEHREDSATSDAHDVTISGGHEASAIETFSSEGDYSGTHHAALVSADDSHVDAGHAQSSVGHGASATSSVGHDASASAGGASATAGGGHATSSVGHGASASAGGASATAGGGHATSSIGHGASASAGGASATAGGGHATASSGHGASVTSSSGHGTSVTSSGGQGFSATVSGGKIYVSSGHAAGGGQAQLVTTDTHGASASAGGGHVTAISGHGASSSAGGASATAGGGRATASSGHGASASAGGASATAGGGRATASAGHGASATAGGASATAGGGRATASAGHGASATSISGHGASATAGGASATAGGGHATSSGGQGFSATVSGGKIYVSSGHAAGGGQAHLVTTDVHGGDGAAAAAGDGYTHTSSSGSGSSSASSVGSDGRVSVDVSGPGAEAAAIGADGSGVHLSSTGGLTHIDETDCECVPAYLCGEDGFINTFGAGIIDISSFSDRPAAAYASRCGAGKVCCRHREEREPVGWLPSRCGTRSPVRLDRRVVTGEATRIGQYPWMVALIRVVPATPYQPEREEYLCGGSLIRENVVLTGAHCVKKHKDEQLIARVGEWDTSSADSIYPHQNLRVVEVVYHEQFDDQTLFHDVALLRLEQPAEISPHVNTICLPTADDYYINYSDCYATGWGQESFDKAVYSSLLKEVPLSKVDSGQCEARMQQTRLGRWFKLHDSFLCAGGHPRVDTCRGDGGSPLVCRDTSHQDEEAFVQIGVVAWGINCHRGGFPGVYADVIKLLPWIQKKLPQLSGELSSVY